MYTIYPYRYFVNRLILSVLLSHYFKQACVINEQQKNDYSLTKSVVFLNDNLIQLYMVISFVHLTNNSQ